MTAFFLFWFAGSVHDVLRSSRRESVALADVAFGGAVASGVLVAVAFSGILAVAQRAGTAGGINWTAVLSIWLFARGRQGMTKSSVGLDAAEGTA